MKVTDFRSKKERKVPRLVAWSRDGGIKAAFGALRWVVGFLWGLVGPCWLAISEGIGFGNVHYIISSDYWIGVVCGIIMLLNALVCLFMHNVGAHRWLKAFLIEESNDTFI